MLFGSLILVLSLSGLSAVFYTQMQNEAEQAASLENEIELASGERVVIMKKLKEAKEEKELINVELTEYSQKLQKIEVDISDTSQIKETLLSRLSEKESMILALSDKLDSAKSQQQKLETELEEAKESYQQVMQEIDDTRRDKAAMEEKLKESLSRRKGIELKKIVVRVAPTLQGKIIELSSEYNFAIVNLGIENRVKSGDMLGIYRNDNVIAEAVIENVYEDMSSIIILDRWADVQLFPGDSVRLIKA